MPDEFQIQINDDRLPLIRGLARTEIVIQKNKSDVISTESKHSSCLIHFTNIGIFARRILRKRY